MIHVANIRIFFQSFYHLTIFFSISYADNKKTSLAADFPHLLEAISIILTSVVIFLSCLPLCYSGPPFSLSNARRFCRRDNHRSLWFSSGPFPVCCDTVATLIPPLAISPLLYSGLSFVQCSARPWLLVPHPARPCPLSCARRFRHRE